MLKEELSKLSHLAENFEMLRTGRHVNEVHGRAYFEMLEFSREYTDVFEALGYSLLSGASDQERVDFFYFDVHQKSDNKKKTSGSLVVVYAALRAQLEVIYASSVGMGKDLLEILRGRSPVEFGVIVQLTESSDMAHKLSAYKLGAADVERTMQEMVRLGFVRRDDQRGYFFLPPASRLEQACSQFVARAQAQHDASVSNVSTESEKDF